MTIAPVKNRLENIINLPNNMPAKVIKALMQDAMERSWDDVENLQKAAWKIPDSHNRNIVDKEVERSYQLRYGDAPAKQDATGRVINQEKEWNPIKGTDSDKIVKIGLKLRSLSLVETNENIFRGMENGLNILRNADDKAVKVEGNFGESAQKLFEKVLQTKSMPEILKALKTGLITDCVMSYQNRDLRADVKKNKVAQILNVFNQDEEELDIEQEGEFDDEGQDTLGTFKNKDKKTSGEFEGTSTDQSDVLPDDIKGFIWNSQESSGDCAQYNGRFFAVEDLPLTHPNCRCTMEVVFRDGLEEVKLETEEKKDKPTELSNAEKKKLNEKIYKRNIKDLEYFEGKISHIYLDTEGNMTAGTGTNVENRQIFQTVNFRDRDGNLLSKEEKDALYDQIQEDKKQIKDIEEKTANYYKNKWGVQIDDAERQALMKNHIEDDIEALREMCKERGKDFDKLPPSQQDALLDMRYNMGSINPNKWVKFYDAFNIDDYDIMATESHRNTPVPEERNEWTRKKFEKAKKEAQIMR